MLNSRANFVDTFPGQFEDTSDNSTLQNYQLYQLITLGPSPVTLAEMKLYLGIVNNINDALIQSLIDSCTAWGEIYTARDFRVNVYDLLIDSFPTRIELRKNPVNIINNIQYIRGGIFVVVDDSIFYLKNGVQISEILLNVGEEWPQDVDEIEQAVKINFSTKAVDARKIVMAENAIKRHVAYMYENRGDCVDCGSCSGVDAANVDVLYNFMRIPRF